MLWSQRQLAKYEDVFKNSDPANEVAITVSREYVMDKHPWEIEGKS